jgi:diacylglycerol kinase
MELSKQTSMETIGWRDRRRSRVREIADGAGMLFTDVAVIRTLVVVGVMLVVAFLARKHSKFVLWLVVASVFFMFCEMFNTITEMLVDRISLETHPFSARIKHASAFVSAVSGLIAFSLLFVVLYNLLISPSAPAASNVSARDVSSNVSARDVSARDVSASNVSSALPPGDMRLSSDPSSAPPRPASSPMVHSKMWDRRVASKRRYRKRGLLPGPGHAERIASTA